MSARFPITGMISEDNPALSETDDIREEAK